MDIKIAEPRLIEPLVKLFVASNPWKKLGTSPEDIRSVLWDSQVRTLVGLEGDKITGAVAFEMTGSLRGYIKLMLVCKEYAGKGTGRLLMNAAENEIFAVRNNVFLCVSGFNTSAIRFYEALGYTQVGVLNNYIINGEDEILMRKTIGPLYQR